MFLKSILAKAAPDRGGLSATQQALEAQAALLPYALGVFAISLPAYVWAGSHADCGRSDAGALCAPSSPPMSWAS